LIVGAFSDDTAVRSVALSLITYLACYQFFDAVQTISGFSLRALKVTVPPLLVHLVCFWGVGLGGGLWLAWRGWPWAPVALGVVGFWQAALISLMLAAVLITALQSWVLRRRRAGLD
jgi:MATE family multidrug resistance protein